MKYFKSLPKITYNGLETVDMSVRFKVVDAIMKNHNAYYNYYWQDSDRIDVIASKYYGNPDLAWLAMLSGEIFDWIYDLPLSSNDFYDYMARKYPEYDIDTLKATVYSYHDIVGTTIDKLTYDALDELDRSSTSVYQYEHDLNESKRHIKLISKSLVSDIVKEFDGRLQEIKNVRRLSNYDTRN